jgi:hypothetical protein
MELFEVVHTRCLTSACIQVQVWSRICGCRLTSIDIRGIRTAFRGNGSVYYDGLQGVSIKIPDDLLDQSIGRYYPSIKNAITINQ